MKSTLTIISLLILSILGDSCSIQKRTYNKGYFVQWNSKSKVQPKKTESKPIKTIESENVYGNENLTSDNIIQEESDSFIKEEVHSNFKPSLIISNKKSEVIIALKKQFKPTQVKRNSRRIFYKKQKKGERKSEDEFNPLWILASIFLLVGILFFLFSFSAEYFGIFLIVIGVFFILTALIIFGISSIGSKEKKRPRYNQKESKNLSKGAKGLIMLLVSILLYILSVAILIYALSNLLFILLFVCAIITSTILFIFGIVLIIIQLINLISENS